MYIAIATHTTTRVLRPRIRNHQIIRTISQDTKDRGKGEGEERSVTMSKRRQNFSKKGPSLQIRTVPRPCYKPELELFIAIDRAVNPLTFSVSSGITPSAVPLVRDCRQSIRRTPRRLHECVLQEIAS
jgi:hypothetical protein